LSGPSSVSELSAQRTSSRPPRSATTSPTTAAVHSVNVARATPSAARLAAEGMPLPPEPALSGYPGRSRRSDDGAAPRAPPSPAASLLAAVSVRNVATAASAAVAAAADARSRCSTTSAIWKEKSGCA